MPYRYPDSGFRQSQLNMASRLALVVAAWILFAIAFAFGAWRAIRWRGGPALSATVVLFALLAASIASIHAHLRWTAAGIPIAQHQHRLLFASSALLSAFACAGSALVLWQRRQFVAEPLGARRAAWSVAGFVAGLIVFLVIVLVTDLGRMVRL
jgi:hypothetical protein